MAVERTTRQRRIGFLEQIDWGTPLIASSQYETLSYNAGSVIPDQAVTLNTFDVTGTSGLIPKQSRAFIDNISGLPTISFAGPATRKALAVHFAAALQSAIEYASTPFDKTIKHICDTAVPDFVANTGSTLHLFTIATDNISGTDGVILENALLNEFTFTIEPNSQGIAKLAQISGTWIGNEMALNQNLSGTWVAESLANFYNDTDGLALTVAGLATLSNYSWKRYQVTISNNVTSDYKVASKANNYKLAPTITVTVTLPYDSSTYTLLNTYKSGTTGSIVLESGTAALTAGHLQLTSYGRITATPIGTDGNYESINLTMNCEVNTSAGFSFAAVISDATDRNWPAS